MALNRRTYTLLTLALAAAPAFAQVNALSHLTNLRSSLGLDGQHSFAQRNAIRDEAGRTHVRFQQFYQGVPVFGGMAITHTDATGSERPITDHLVRNIALNVQPNLAPAEAVAVAHGHLAPTGAYAQEPTAKLVVYPVKALAAKAGRFQAANAEDFEEQVIRHVLAYHVHTSLRNEGETRDTDYIIDAHTGAILDTWDDLHTTAAVGSGISQFSGTVALNTNLNGSNYELKDTVRSMNISTYNLNHGTSGTGTLYTDADDAWGNGTNYTGSTTSTTSATGQTAAVDAHYGVGITFDFYKNLFGRNGIDGAGKATYSRVHYSTSYDNAFWDDTCFCMTYGDGSSFKSLEAPDVAGHEMSHGVCASTANLTYSGESGGLNEANSDMFGNMVELYARNGFTMPATVANTDACWTVGEQLSSTPLRYMYKPSLDGSSPNAWSSTVKNLDVHYSSGPANRMFFFLSQGASATNTSNYYSSYAPSGFSGIGPEKAIRIWYKALTTYMTSSTNYAAARTAALSAASDLYGAAGAEYAAVQNAFGAINVGALASTGVSVVLTPSTATLAPNATQQFTAAVSGSTTTTVTWTCTGGTVTSAGLYTAPATVGTYTVTATSTADTSKSASATVTVTTGSTTYAEVESNGTIATANAVGNAVTKITGFIGTTTDADYFKVLVGAGATLTVNMTGPAKDYDLYLYNASGTKLASSTGTTSTESVTYKNTGTAGVNYYILVKGYNKAYSTTAGYTLALTR
ncbi:M4 family metallopeptidase [Mesoterricola silvestris]|uniref:Zn-dependent metalloprotease n=1 Tax=Mesoterricola silvestris TaxID=2927979 RepID=A0AA48GM75_9BACT|nr:M4 family metallopeptidase [Mesoterricola silvestris]BDU72055.1 hypothetical protein METEAL_12290 [Mesoterricola silvestris]